MFTIIAFAAGGYVGFMAGARYGSVTALVTRIKIKVAQWTSGGQP